jgi:hypothetical protein
MTICEKFCTGKLPDKQNLNKKEAELSESSRGDEWPRMGPTIPAEGIPHVKNQTAKIKKVKSWS